MSYQHRLQKRDMNSYIMIPKTTDPAELAKRSEGCDIVMIANNPYPTEVVEKADALKMLSVAFTGIDHIGTDKCKEKIL